MLQAAETALALNSSESAEALFRLAASGPESSKSREAGLSGIAWSQFKSQKYPEAEKSFAALVAEFPAAKEAAQAIFMQARCVEEQGDQEKIAVAFGTVFDQLTQDVTAVPAGGEAMPPMVYAFDAGKQSARALAKLKRFADADRAWKKLTTIFPDAKELDSLLDEWAWMHFAAENFAADRTPFIDNCWNSFRTVRLPDRHDLSLAESLLEAGQLESALKEMEAIVADARYGDDGKGTGTVSCDRNSGDGKKLAANGCCRQEHFSPIFLPVRSRRRFVSSPAMLCCSRASLMKPFLFSNALREDIISEKVRKEDWIDRVWIVLAEAALAKQDYERIDTLQADLKQRSPESLFAFQLNDVQGRRWKQQAPPDFVKAREYFQRVTGDPQAEGTETSARCQFLMAETYLMESNHETAAKEYFKVYLNYAGHDELRAQALFQGASCQVALKKTELAIRDFKELIQKFPTSNLVNMANEELKKLE